MFYIHSLLINIDLSFFTLREENMLFRIEHMKIYAIFFGFCER